MSAHDAGRVMQTSVPAAVRRFWWLFLAIVLALAGLGAAYGAATAPQAVTTASLVVEDPRSSGLLAAGAPSDSYVLDQAIILQLPVTVELVASDLREDAVADLSTEEFLDALDVQTDGESNLLTITFRHPDADVPVPAVNALVERYRDVLTFQAQRAAREQLERIDREVARLDVEVAAAGASRAGDDLRAVRADLVEQRAAVALNQAGGDNGIRVVSPAKDVVIDRGIGEPVGAALGGLLGLVPGAAAAYLLAQRRRRFGYRYQPEAVLHRPLLTEIPDFKAERLKSDLAVVSDPDSSAAESFRFLSAALAVQQRTSTLRSLAVVSAGSRDGKTTVAANLAITAARDGQRVLAIDADLSGQGLGFLLLGDRRSGPGLVQILDGSAQLEAVVQRAEVGGTGLDVLTGGSDDRYANELFGSSRAAELFATLVERYDLLVLDVPPVLQVAYTGSLLSRTDAALLVVPHGAAVAGIEELGERLTYLDVAVAGYVYNKAPLRREVGRHSRLVSDHRRRPADLRVSDRPAEVVAGSADREKKGA